MHDPRNSLLSFGLQQQLFTACSQQRVHTIPIPPKSVDCCNRVYFLAVSVQHVINTLISTVTCNPHCNLYLVLLIVLSIVFYGSKIDLMFFCVKVPQIWSVVAFLYDKNTCSFFCSLLSIYNFFELNTCGQFWKFHLHNMPLTLILILKPGGFSFKCFILSFRAHPQFPPMKEKFVFSMQSFARSGNCGATFLLMAIFSIGLLVETLLFELGNLDIE